MTKRRDEFMHTERWREPRELFEQACCASRIHDACVKQALEMYGDHGPDVSGVGRDHFPDDVKTYLRQLARKVTEKSQAAWAARPKGVRAETMRLLASVVAEERGSGFYGPQPRRNRRGRA